MDKVVSRDGTTIAYEKAGDGPPLVLLNGAFRDHTIFDQIVPQLTPYCTTYVYDRRGRGESGDAASYAPEREIEDLEAVMEAAGGEVAVFAGSSGANLALRAAIHGTPMTRLALHEPYFRVPGFPRPPEDLIERMQAMLAEGRNAEVIEYWSHEFMDLSPEQYAIWRRNPTMWAENLTRTHTLI
jgi:pimeloyl-ACP methyl ester carboxylesterase